MRPVCRYFGMVTAWLGIGLALEADAQVNGGRRAPSQAGAARQAAPAPIDPKARQKMDQLLTQWEAQSRTVDSLDARFTREDVSIAFQERTLYEGRALLKSPDRAFLDFSKAATKDKARVHHERIICTGDGEVYQYVSTTKQIFIYPLAKEERKRALEEGPLPFLFNMRADQAKQRYDMTLVKEIKNTSDGTLDAWIIQIIPLQKIDKDSFSKALVQLNAKKFLPDRILLFSPSGKDTQDFRFTSISKNVAIEEKNFEGTLIRGWSVVRNPENGGQPQQADAGAPASSRGGPAPGRSAAPRR